MTKSTRNLVVILGDQLDHNSAALKDFDPENDLVWMAEVAEESEHVWSHKARITLFLTAMRHFRQELETAGRPVIYHALSKHEYGSLSQALAADIDRLRPARLVLGQAGD